MRSIAQLSALSVVCALATACGGGSVGSSPAPAPSVTSSTTQGFTFAQGGTVALPSVANISSSVTFPGVPGSAVASFTVSVSSQAPSGAPALSVSRAPAGGRSVQDIGTGNGLVYVTITTPQAVALPAGPSFVFTLPSVVVTDTYYLAALNGAQWVLTYEGPGTISGTTVSFAANPNPINLSSQTFALIAVPTAGLPSPTPNPNASATATPLPSSSASPSPTPLPISLLPASIVVSNLSNPTNATPPSSAQPTFTATLPGFTGSFAGSLSCPSSVAILANGTVASSGGSATFTVNVVGAGTCDLSITAGTVSEVVPSFVSITGH